jgi:hypothetical protein
MTSADSFSMTHSRRLQKQLAIGVLAGLVVLEWLAPQLNISYLSEVARDWKGSAPMLYMLARKCGPAVTAIKSQFFVLLLMLFPFKAVLMHGIFGLRVRFPAGVFAKIWTAIVALSSSLLGLVPIWLITIQDPLAPSFKFSDKAMLAGLCSEPSWGYFFIHSAFHLFAALCAYPAVLLAGSTLARVWTVAPGAMPR